MLTQTMPREARSFADGPAAALAAFAPPAAPTPAAAAILNQTAEVRAGFVLDTAEASVEYLGEPLGVAAGTNASDEVSLSALGTLRIRRPGGGRLARTHLAYRNAGTFAAGGGDVFSVAYGFCLTPALSAGFVPLASRIGWILTAALGDGTCVVRSGGVAAARSGATVEFAGSFDVASFAASTILGFELLLDIFWTVPEAAAALGATEGALNVNVPANAIDLRLIAEQPAASRRRPIHAPRSRRVAGAPGLALRLPAR